MKAIERLMEPSAVVLSDDDNLPWLEAEAEYSPFSKSEKDCAYLKISEKMESDFERVAGPDADAAEWSLIVRKEWWLVERFNNDTRMVSVKAFYGFQRKPYHVLRWREL